MPSRTTLITTVAALSIFGFSACKTVYSDTFSYRKNNFQAPVAKKTEIIAPPTTPDLLGKAMGDGAMPGEAPGAIPGLPGDGMAPAVPGVPDAAAPPPAVPGIN